MTWAVELSAAAILSVADLIPALGQVVVCGGAV